MAVTPDLSVVVVGDAAEVLRRLLRALDAQTAKGRMEVVVVAPAAAHRAIDAAMPSGLAGWRLLDRTPLDRIPAAKAEGVRAAAAEVVAFTETHAFPNRGWAEALIGAHAREGCVAVGPALVNANPSPLSWANMFVDYGPFLADGRGDAWAVADLPGHNSSYRREQLLGYGGDLERLLAFETALHDDLRRRGRRMVVEPAARIAHVNVTGMSSWLPERWHAGRIYAGARSRHWPRGRRLLYTLGVPLIPLVRTRRAVRDARRAGHGAVLGRALPFIVIGLAVQSAGEALGYARGPGSMAQLVDMELHRFDYLAADDPQRPR